MIRIREPRYRDNTVLVARYRIPAGGDITIEIERGARAGIYKCKNQNIVKSPIETMKVKSGPSISVRAIPFDCLERVEE